jgi:uncharacterized protein
MRALALCGSLLLLAAAGLSAESANAPSLARGPRLDPIGDLSVPPLKARVTDLTETLSAAQRQALEQELAAFEQRKGAQIAVLLVPTTQPEAIEQYSIRVAESWKLGRKGVDDGLLLLVAKDDRKMRIEVGRGLEGVVPDVIAKRVIAEVITPFFKRGDFYGGVEAGVSRLLRIIDGEPLPAPRQRDPAWWGLDDFLWIGLFLALALGGLLRAWFGRLLGATLTGGVIGVLFWIIIGTLVGALIAAVVGFLVTLIMAAGRGGGGGGWSSGGASSGGGWSGGDGGGFSGGGGDFGGGGASGSW